MSKSYAIRATRSSASVMGGASALVKHNGEIKIYPSRELAEQEAEWWNTQLTSKNVHYKAEELV